MIVEALGNIVAQVHEPRRFFLFERVNRTVSIKGMDKEGRFTLAMYICLQWSRILFTSW